MVYFVVFAMSSFFAYYAQKAKAKDVVIFYSAMCILLPVIMGGLRKVGVGTDTVIYDLPHFWSANNSSSFFDFISSNYRMSREIGWVAVTYFSTKIFGSVNWNFFFQLITLTCTYIALYKHRDKALLACTLLIKEKTLRNVAFVSAVLFCVVNAIKNSAGTWPYESIL